MHRSRSQDGEAGLSGGGCGDRTDADAGLGSLRPSLEPVFDGGGGGEEDPCLLGDDALHIGLRSRGDGLVSRSDQDSRATLPEGFRENFPGFLSAWYENGEV